MYWIYLCAFTFMVFIPELVSGPVYGILEEVLESLLILLMGTIGFSLFLWEEQQAKRNFSKRLKAQKESHRIFRDLNETYSYIGELNRKIDVLKDTAHGISDEIGKKGHFEAFIEALKLFTKAKLVEIVFIDLVSQKAIGTFCSRKSNEQKISVPELIKRMENFIEDENYFLVKSFAEVKGIVAWVIIQRNGASHKIEDIDIIKTIAAHALYRFIFSDYTK